jgi:hypothetical protein
MFPVRAGEPLEAGPLVHEFRLTLEPGWRREMLGPLLFNESREDGRKSWGFAPLFVHEGNAGTDHEEYDVLYPLLTYDRFGDEYRWQLAQWISFSGRRTIDDEPSHGINLFPFFFSSFSSNPTNSYWALFPVYGHLINRFFRSEVRFVLAPLYVQSRRGDLITENYVYPFFHRRHGGAQGWQFWPLYGTEHREPKRITDSEGDTRLIPGYDKHFVLWPLWLYQRGEIGTENPTVTYGSLPLFGVRRSPLLNSEFLLLFNHTVDREKHYREWGTPWPLVVFARGEGKTANRVWPLFSRVDKGPLHTEFYAWPLWYRHTADLPNLYRDRKRIVFFLWSDLTERNKKTGREFRRRDLWPLFTHRQDLNGNTRLQIFAPVEPMLPNNKSFERGWSPLWSLWRAEHSSKTGASSQSLLWNLWRRDATTNSVRTSFLFGIVKTERTEEGRRWRWFWVGGKKRADAIKSRDARE